MTENLPIPAPQNPGDFLLYQVWGGVNSFNKKE